MRAASADALSGAAGGWAGAARAIEVMAFLSGGVRAGRAETAEVDGDQFAVAVGVGRGLATGRRRRVGGGRFAGLRGQLGVLALADAGLGFAVGEDLAEVAADGV